MFHAHAFGSLLLLSGMFSVTFFFLKKKKKQQQQQLTHTLRCMTTDCFIHTFVPLVRSEFAVSSVIFGWAC